MANAIGVCFVFKQINSHLRDNLPWIEALQRTHQSDTNHTWFRSGCCEGRKICVSVRTCSGVLFSFHQERSTKFGTTRIEEAFSPMKFVNSFLWLSFRSTRLQQRLMHWLILQRLWIELHKCKMVMSTNSLTNISRWTTSENKLTVPKVVKQRAALAEQNLVSQSNFGTCTFRRKMV